MFRKYIRPNLCRGEVKEYCELIRYEQRDLVADDKVQDYLRQHKVYVSLTTSPIRLRKITTMLSIVIRCPYVDKVVITLPLLYRNKEPYDEKDIEFVKSLDYRIRIKRIKTDIGPITKILPFLQSVPDDDAIVISLDDDIGYPISLFNELIYYSVHKPNVIHTGAGFIFGDYDNSDINRKYWPQRRAPVSPYKDIVEGWGGIAYKKRFVDFDLLYTLNSSSNVCKLSDDLTISLVLTQKGIKKREIDDEYYDRDMLFPFNYGLQEDALHRGSGVDSKSDCTEHDINMEKYKKCIKSLEDFV